TLKSKFYKEEKFNPKTYLADADLVIVHEWNQHDIVKKIGDYRKDNPHFKLLFHDTHHRAVTDVASMSAYDLSNYDGVLAYGRVIRDIYITKGWAPKAWTWHEAADTSVFFPRNAQKEGDLVWIGNWGDDERTAELHEYLITPVKELKLKATVYGVRYPKEAIKALKDAGIKYGGWLPNHKAPEVFAQYHVTVHVPRRPYVKALPGIPTIRPFEAMACGIPLISAPWHDAEQLFTKQDLLWINSGEEMKNALQLLLANKELANTYAKHALKTIHAKHTCAHRVDQLLEICSLIDQAINKQEASLINN
ncbi:MAG TPA: glycosyltransferase, partial [Cytophagales bacterium]|nr:glycosyltransferase [Cytophagales bacterium]